MFETWTLMPILLLFATAGFALAVAGAVLDKSWMVLLGAALFTFCALRMKDALQ